jgi:hypothetical protein
VCFAACREVCDARKDQYTQTVLLNFLGLSWPHVSVATRTKTFQGHHGFSNGTARRS